MADHPAASTSITAPALPAQRTAILQSLASLATRQAGAQLDAFITRLADALFASSEKATQPDQRHAALQAFHHLSRNRATFQRMASSALDKAVQREIQAPAMQPHVFSEQDIPVLSLVTTVEALEVRTLAEKASQAIGAKQAAHLNALTIRLARVLQEESLPLERNPFRPDVFVGAIVEAWNEFDLANGAQRVMLRHLSPEVFIQMEPVWRGLNDALIVQGILPDLALADLDHENATGTPREEILHEKLQHWLSASTSDNSLDATSASAELLSWLHGSQATASSIDEIKTIAPAGLLAPDILKVIDLLAAMFDHVLRQSGLPAPIQGLLARLQVPVLCAALTDQQFFLNGEHPARRLIDTMARAGTLLDPQTNDDPFVRAVEPLIEQLQVSDQYSESFSRAATDLAALIEQETHPAQAVLSQATDEAMRLEKIAQCHRSAADEVATRIATGEVAGFVETFLEAQWTRVLTVAYSVQDTKPEVLRNALATMDDLIWSAKPKTSPEERKELIGKLPSMLSLLNAWLNLVKWEGAEREAFFSALAERHAALVRIPVERNPRHHLENTMTIVQKASEYHISRCILEQQRIADQFAQQVEGFATGLWMALPLEGGDKRNAKLIWVSSTHSHFIFAGRQGQELLTLTAEQLAESLRAGHAVVIAANDSIFSQALAAAVQKMNIV